MSWLVINKGGNYPIYDGYQNYKKVGTLYNREAFIAIGGEEFENIMFLSSDGKLRTAGVDTYRYPFPTDGYNYCTDYPYSIENINGVNYYIFKMRRTMNVYKSDSNYWGKVAAGMYIATHSSTTGESHKDWLIADYIKDTNGSWVRIDEKTTSNPNGKNYGFVDTGLSIASGYSSIPLYGSW